MASEEFTIRISKKGEIIIELDGVPVRKVRSLVEFFEETIGPVKQIDAGDDGGDASGGVQFEETEDEEEEQDRPHGDRLRREEE